ncbi:MAG TPA: biopolymer transporter ExbD [Candidatus Paceibacterota bacterium]|nr:biopolymer transporter ExbD [Candidatus Paceibacterota bacterium]
MQFHIRKRRQTPAVIIVALIDVLIVLLIFLMVTTTFRQQAALRLALPESSQAQKSGASETAPVIVSIDAKGMLRLMKNNDPVPVTDDRLKDELKAMVAKNPDQKLAISADKDAPFGQVVKVMDAAKDAKIKMVNAFTKEPARQ